MKRKGSITMMLSPELFNEIERRRGKEKRSTFIERLMRLAIKKMESRGESL